jgi:hypothetical protein
MTTMKVSAEIAEDGTLRLEVPTGLPAGRAEVLVVVQPEANGKAGSATANGRAVRSGLFAGKSVSAIDVDATLDEMNQVWRSKLSGQR